MATRDILIRLGAVAKAGAAKTIGRLQKAALGLRAAASGARTAMLALGLPLGFLVNEAIKFEKGMAEVNTLLNLNTKELAALTKNVKEMSVEFGKAPLEVTAALYQTVSAGIADTSEATKFLNIALKAAVAGLAKTEDSVNLLTNVMDAYKLSVGDAGRISDIAFATVKEGKTTFSELAASMGNVLPIAGELGIGMEELFASVATLTKTGLRTDKAVTSLRGVIVSILKPSKEMSAVLKKVGFESGVAAIKQLGFQGVLKVLKKEIGDNADAMIKLFPQTESMGSAMALAGGSAKELDRIIKILKNSVGATNEALLIMQTTAGFKVTKALNAMRVAGVEVGSQVLPEIAKLIDALGGAEAIGLRVKFAFLGIQFAVATIVKGLLLMAKLAEIAAFKLERIKARSLFGAGDKRERQLFAVESRLRQEFGLLQTKPVSGLAELKQTSQEIADAKFRNLSSAERGRVVGEQLGQKVNQAVGEAVTGVQEGVQRKLKTTQQNQDLVLGLGA